MAVYSALASIGYDWNMQTCGHSSVASPQEHDSLPLENSEKLLCVFLSLNEDRFSSYMAHLYMKCLQKHILVSCCHKWKDMSHHTFTTHYCFLYPVCVTLNVAHFYWQMMYILTSTSPVSFSLRTKLRWSGSGPAINLSRRGRSHRGSFWNKSGINKAQRNI